MFIAANWKMNLEKQSIEKFVNNLNNFKFSNKVEACLFPPTIYIEFLNNLINKLPLHVGGQNCHSKLSGAFTGETSSKFLVDTGCKYVILGHSERRMYNNETNADIKLQIKSALEVNLIPILCVGENLIDREKGCAREFVENQLLECLPKNFDNLLVAYEPIWSIGTGKIPNVSEIYEMHDHIKKIVSLNFKKNLRTIYGGSVNISNIQNILTVNQVDGVLIGGASLKVKEFLAIYTAAVKHLDKFC